MASPLSPSAGTVLNTATPSTSFRHNIYPDHYNISNAADETDNPPSSPLVVDVPGSVERENISPIKPSSSPVDRKPTFPIKALKTKTAIESISQSPIKDRSLRKQLSPEKRFPVKISAFTESRLPTMEQMSTVKNMLSSNEGLTRAFEILEDEDTVLNYGQGVEGSDKITTVAHDDGEQDGFADETAFSTFSAVPDMTMFAGIGHSPSKLALFAQTPRTNGQNSPATTRTFYDCKETPTPRRGAGDRNGGNTTNLILDFTEQFNGLSRSGHGHPSPSRQEWPVTKTSIVPDHFSFAHNARTPSPTKGRQQTYSPRGRITNLLDFDIPPAPTPRSLPSITPRELESLKSTFLSEISSLKASLSGREAEVQSLKTAVGDAEKRVGESMEQVREERNLKEQLAIENEGWEKRGRDMEVVLRNVKEEIVHGQRERDALEGQLEETEKRREAAEIMAQEAESKMAALRAGSSFNELNCTEKAAGPGGREAGFAAEKEAAVAKVARELHVLYKSKHETKVAALKKSYENRWDKKIKELQAKIDELTKENEDLRIGRDATMSGVIPRISGSDATNELRLQIAQDAKQAKELEARLEGLSEEVKSVKRDNADLRRELEQERVEKGELVAACDELLALQEIAPASHPAVTSGMENLRGSISRASGLRAPNFSGGSGIPMHSTESRIGKVERGRSGSAQGSRPGSGLGLRSGIMSSIEKMGSYKG